MTVQVLQDGAVQVPESKIHNKSGGLTQQTADAGTKATDIIDIRREVVGISVLDELRRGLRVAPGVEKRLPTLLLYDEPGLQLFEKITYLDEYYLTNEEIGLLEKYSDRIAERIAPDSIVVELGSGNLRKVNILLQALERAQKRVVYYALDLDRVELERTIAAVPRDYQYVTVKGLHGTYDDGAVWLTSPHVASYPKCILSLGSSIGNFSRQGGADFVKQFADILQTGDTMLIALDGCKEPERVYHAYNDRDDVTHQFILNGLKQANRLLQTEAFDLRVWRVIGEFDASAGRHHAFVSPTEDTVIDGVFIKRDERVRIEESYKFSPEEVVALFQYASLAEGARWMNERGDYGLHMASKPTVTFSPKAGVYAARPVPSLQEFEELWTAWDMITQHMIPEDQLLTKPINLRNVCLFYLGHIPTFLDMQVTKAVNGEPTEPSHYPNIFERGIDPDVDDPTHIHAHSEVPDEWPPKEEILAFQDRVRARIQKLYETGAAYSDRKVGRALWLGLEHEVMHIETLLYMLIQSENMLPPDGVITPDFGAMAKTAATHAVPNEWVTVPERELTVGLEDPESDDGPDRYFGWDNEKPPRKAYVGAFQAKARPITNGEFAEYLEKNHLDAIPASWTTSAALQNGQTNGINGVTNGVNGTGVQVGAPSKAFLRGKAVKTVFGNVPLEYALSWPVLASYDELSGCADWMGGHIPTADEVRSIYAYVEELKEKDNKLLAVNIPAVNSHLLNDGVEETPPQGGAVKRSSNGASPPSPADFFVDLDGANVGFKHWHPVPVTQHGRKLCGQGELGGAWEWTSTVLEKHDGFEPMRLYPAYTADFFDGKHNIVLGGSWATHPRVAGRKTFVNWYQHNYPYVWAGARLVRDA
ncbi:hypothetical protein NA57DRAFT_33375 [Rhizodiscina lignyota]|uniref:Uncharacterized protein n=1 Tax=Rhizodiscina lignyota TaxID=1504668 RepID=A0A9P4IQN3_9PEZI|nr:hypothetical protein NA57DRAFT_33375 [Rhizodiscina lignyota]